MAAREDDIVADEMEDETCDQTGENSAGQVDQEPDKPDESNIEQDNAAGHNPSAIANASPANAESSSGESPPKDRKDVSNNGNSTLLSNARRILPYAGAAVATGAIAVVAAPVALSAAGFTAGGVAAGSAAASIQSVFYGGYVASGSAFALAQSAGAAGIGAAGNAAIGGIGAGIGALGNGIFNWLRRGVKLLICGWGTEARVFSSIASSVKGTKVRVLPDRWNMPTNDFKITFHRNGEEPTCITCKPPQVAHNPEDAMKDVDIVVFMLPDPAHKDLLHALRPYIKPGVIIVGLPGGPGFDFQVREALGAVMQQCTIMNFESSPWICCSTEFGNDCEVFATNEILLGTIKEGKDAVPKEDQVSTLQSLLGPRPKLSLSRHL